MIKSNRLIDAMMGVTIRLWAGAVFLLLLCGNAQAVLVYQAQIRSMDLTAQGVNGPLVFHLDAAQASTGMVSVAPNGTAGDINPGDGKATVVGSFFDIFADLEPMNCFPNCPDKTPVEEHIKTSGSCGSVANFFDVFPPDCPYEGDQTFTIEDVIAVVRLAARLRRARGGHHAAVFISVVHRARVRRRRTAKRLHRPIIR